MWYKFNAPALTSARREAGSWPRQSLPAPTQLLCTCAVAAAWVCSQLPCACRKVMRGLFLSPPPSSLLKVGRVLVIMCNFSWSFHCSRILRQSVPASNGCGISQVPLSTSKECCMGGAKHVFIASELHGREKERINCSCKELN